MPLLRNKSSVPSGMLAPSGLAQTLVNPAVQSTTRPPGTLLAPSPGYDSVRAGKNVFQGRGPTGGFKPLTFAEDVGGTGSVLSVVPGQTSAIDASSWLPESLDSLPEGSLIIADRTHEPGFAQRLHEAYGTIPDMGDRIASRPLSRGILSNPIGLFRTDYQEHPAMTVLATGALVWLISVIARDAERMINGYRPRSVGTAVSEPVAAVPETAGDITKQITDATGEAVNRIGQAADSAVNKISSATESAVNKIDNAAA